jgi:hypothetical protein
MNPEMAHEMEKQRWISRRSFLGGTAAAAAALGWSAQQVIRAAADTESGEHAPLRPVGEPKGIHPGRVVWVRDLQVLDWKGPGDGHWYEGGRTRQERVDAMMGRAVCRLTGASGVAQAWEGLFRYLNLARGKGAVGYREGERLVIKPNWVGMIWREGAVDAESYSLVKRQDYMNTAPQMIIALVRQLRSAGVRDSDIAVCDTLAYLVNEYHAVLHAECPAVRYLDFAGKFGREKVQASTTPLYWSCRPGGMRVDHVPTCFVEAEYVVNVATLKAHVATGVTLCGKNHFGSLVRWPVEQGYYDMHRHSFLKEAGRYREQVDLLGHAHLGGKTVLNLIDGLFCGSQ